MLNARRAERADARGIEALIGRNVLPYVKKFGAFSITNLIEGSVLAVTVFNDAEEIVGFGSFLDAPPVGLQKGNLQQDKCMEWFKNTFRSEVLSAENTAWLTFFIAESTVEGDVADRLLQTVFSTLPVLEGVLGVVPHDVQVFAPVKEMFEELPLIDENFYGPRVFACPRSFFIPPLTIRRAQIEDHDDLVPVFNEQSEVLTDIYGEFFLADLIENHNPRSHSLVAEINGRAVGLMAVTDEVDVELLRHTFELAPFDNLYVVEEEEEDESPVVVEEKEATPEERLAKLFHQLASPEGELAQEAVEGVLKAYVSSLDIEGPDQALAEPAKATLAVFLGDPTKGTSRVLTLESFVKGMLELSKVLTGAMVEVVDYLEANVDRPEGAVSLPPEAAQQLESEDDEEKEELLPDNCFAITLFCLDEGFEARSLAFLEPAFQLFPEKEYCIITLPHTAHESALLSHFTQVPAKPVSTLPHVLYLLHRDSVSMSEVSLRWMGEADVPALQALYEGADNAGDVQAALASAIANRADAVARAQAEVKAVKGTDKEGNSMSARAAFLTQNAAFVVECYQQPVGLLVLHERKDVEMLRSQYAVEDFVDLVDLYSDSVTLHGDAAALKAKREAECLQGVVKYFIINPLFLNKSSFVFREAMRLFFKSILLYEKRPDEPLQDVTRIFAQVRPRSKPMQSPELVTLEEGDFADPKPFLPHVPEGGHFALHCLTRRLLSQPKTMLNARVVVVGASTTAIAFLEALLLQSDLNYSSICLVSTHGLPSGHNKAAASNFSPWSLEYDDETMRKLAIESRVRVIQDSVVDLDCDRKELVLSDGAVLPYDFLVLSPGLQDQTAGVLGVESESLFTLVDETDVDALMHFVDETNPESFLVYGNTLRAVCAIRGLMDEGVSANSITWASPYPADKPQWCMGDVEVDAKVRSEMAALGMTIMHNSELINVVLDDDNMITAAVLRITEANDGEPTIKDVEIPCQILVALHSFDVNAAVFTFMTQNSLVYDGRIVVDCNFATADPCVFAAGTTVKFSRRYGVTLPLERYSSVEVGQRLADSLLRQMDPIAASAPQEEGMFTQPPTLGEVAKVLEGGLPGGFMYFTAIKPLLNPIKAPKVLVTTANNNICRLVFDDLDVLVSITYLGKQNIQSGNLRRLVGLPSNMLNRIHWRMEQGKIPDLIAFLQAPWATALAHESFSGLSQQLSDDLASRQSEIQEILERYLAHASQRQKGHPVDSAAVSNMVETFLPAAIKRDLQVKALQFLNMHANHLPGYQVQADPPPA